MTATYYTGNAQLTTDTWTFTVAALGSPTTSNTFTITINGKSITYVAVVSETVTTVATALTALLVASTIPEFLEYAWTSLVGVITATAVVSGRPGVITRTVSNGGGAGTPTFAISNTVAGTGPSDAANVNNLSTGALPANSSTVIIPPTAPPILYGLASWTNTPTSVIIQSGYLQSGQIGLPIQNPAGYPEYRALSLILKAASIFVGDGTGSGGSAPINIGASSTQTALNVQSGVVSFSGTSTSNTADVTGGTLNLAPNPADDSKLATLNVSGGTVVESLWATPPVNINQSGGAVTLANGYTGTYTQTGGSSVIGGTGAFTALNVGNGTCSFIGSGATGAAVVINSGGTLDKSKDISAVTFASITINSGGSVIDPSNVITVTAGYAKGTNVRTLSGT